MFKKGPRGSRAPDTTKVPIKRVMLMCQRENGVNVKYSDSDRFGCPGTMGLWDLHSSDALNQAKMQLPSGSIDANFCPCCTFYSTNNETLNNHVRKHYGMGLTCRSDGFMTASVAAMKMHMETEHGYEGKRAGVVKKLKGKGKNSAWVGTVPSAGLSAAPYFAWPLHMPMQALTLSSA